MRDVPVVPDVVLPLVLLEVLVLVLLDDVDRERDDRLLTGSS